VYPGGKKAVSAGVGIIWNYLLRLGVARSAYLLSRKSISQYGVFDGGEHGVKHGHVQPSSFARSPFIVACQHDGQSHSQPRIAIAYRRTGAKRHIFGKPGHFHKSAHTFDNIVVSCIGTKWSRLTET